MTAGVSERKFIDQIRDIAPPPRSGFQMLSHVEVEGPETGEEPSTQAKPAKQEARAE